MWFSSLTFIVYSRHETKETVAIIEKKRILFTKLPQYAYNLNSNLVPRVNINDIPVFSYKMP